MDWDFIKNAIGSNKLELLTRDPKMMEKYTEFKSTVNSKYKDGFKDMIYIKIFNYNQVSVDGLIHAEFHQEAIQSPVLTINEFPYHVADGISHHLVWASFPIDYSLHVLPLIDLHFKGKEFLSFVNPPHLQSILTISHYHIFVRDPVV